MAARHAVIVLSVLTGCIPTEPAPTAYGRTAVLVLGDTAWSPAVGSLDVYYEAERPRAWLFYSEEALQLPWPDETILQSSGRRAPVPAVMYRGPSSDDALTEVSGFLAGAWSLPQEPDQSRCRELREVVTSSATRTAARWSSDQVIVAASMQTEIEVCGVTSRCVALTAVPESSGGVWELVSKATRRALVRTGDDGRTYEVSASMLETQLVEVTPAELLATRVGVKGLASPASPEDDGTILALADDGAVYGTSSASISPSSWTEIQDVALDATGDAIFVADVDLIARRGAHDLLYDRPGGRELQPNAGGVYVTSITTVAQLPTIGLIAGGTADIPGIGVVAVLLRYLDDPRLADPWRPYAVLDGFTTVTGLAGHRGGVLFTGDAGWGFYSPKTGSCQGTSALAPIAQVVALANGSFFLRGERRGTGEKDTGAWLVP